MNKSKTKVIMETDSPIHVNNTQMENVESYITQGQRSRDKTQDKEIQKRLTAGWTAFTKHHDIFESNTGTCLKRHIYNLCIFPAMTYGAETWAHTTHAKNKLAAAQTKTERIKANRTRVKPASQSTEEMSLIPLLALGLIPLMCIPLIVWNGKSAREKKTKKTTTEYWTMEQLTEMPLPVSDRIMTMRLPLSKDNFATIISVYAPTMTNPDENKEAFYNQLASVLSGIPSIDK
ncbi:hypothetical protein NP493_358g05028 [Ridgeia piscesae]|uniref:Reverse transcriptase domain-containing protein n=1 Tax=Ridgeia piscesae TaxID=27915 RepID=A0AAD9L3V7_RIDPI|nr:hypothetical protein NP493_358g05028 [Ridgeia piscesae]